MNKVDDALARAVLDGLPYDKVRDNLTVADMAHALATVLPDLAEEKRRAIESALIFAAAHDEDAARPVVDRDALAGAAVRYQCQYGGVHREGIRHDGDDPLVPLSVVLTVVQDAADVRRAVAEEIAADLDECGYYPAATRIRYRLAHGTNGNLGPAAPTAREAGGTP